MKKIFAILLSVCLLLSFVCTAYADEDEGFNPIITITNGNGTITVTVFDESGILETKKPSLTVFCDFDKAYVQFNGATVKSELNTEEGIIAFVVASAGDYTIISGEEKTDPVTPVHPVKPTPVKPTESAEFLDVKESDYFYKPVSWALEKGITTGLSSQLFGPDMVCTRAQVVTFLYRAAGVPAVTDKTNSFVDVKEGDYFYDAVLWAKENGITTGTDATHFSPDESCTRGQVVSFLHRYAAQPEPASVKNDFTDVLESKYYFKPVLWAKEKEITKGTSSTTFGPEEVCTRGQIVTFLYNYMEK